MSFCHISACRKTCPNVLSLSECPDNLEEKIKQERKELSPCFKKYTFGKFIKIPSLESPVVYIYSHKSYLTCSAVLFSQIQAVFGIKVVVVNESLNECEIPAHHYHLEPFFFYDHSVFLQYRMVGNLEGDSKEIISKEIEKLSNLEYPIEPICNWDENQWTTRLVGGISNVFSVETVYSAEMGLHFKRDVLDNTLYVNLLDGQTYFLPPIS